MTPAHGLHPSTSGSMLSCKLKTQAAMHLLQLTLGLVSAWPCLRALVALAPVAAL